MKILCTPLSIAVKEPLDLQCVLFGRSGLKNMASAGPTLTDDIQRFGITPPTRAWDLLSIALAAGVADESGLRNLSSDGWTREFALQVSVQDVAFWRSQKENVQTMLRFLTGDIWEIEFSNGGAVPPKLRKGKQKRISNEDCVCLLSGGADSLAGAIDVAANGKKPLLVSQVSKGDKEHQRVFADTIAGTGHHLQLNHNIEVPGEAERSQRARSLFFITYGVLAATCVKTYEAGEEVTLYIPENGFISLNIPLTPLRMGSLSTRTTHPYYLKSFQQILDAAGLRVKLTNPYQFKTKGELLADCKNEALLKRFAVQSTSCGRFLRMGFRHCGRCVPCIVRRAAFNAWSRKDTTDYVYADLSRNDADHRHFDDVRSASFAVQQVKSKGLDEWIGGALNTAQLGDTKFYRELLLRGIDELAAFLKKSGAL